MRVVHLMYGFEMGGLEQLVVELAARGRERGLEAGLVVLGEDGPMRAEVEKRKLPLRWFPDAAGLSLTALRSIRSSLAQWNANLVHAHDLGPWLNAVAARAVRPATRVLATMHEQALPQGRRRAAAMIAARFTHALVACGDEVRARIASWVPEGTRIVTIGNGVPLPAAASAVERRAARERLGLPQGAVAIGYAGAMKRVKGPDLLLAAFVKRFGGRSDVHLVLMGDGPLDAELRQGAANVRNVHFTGVVMNAAQLLPGLDVYAQTSRSEGRSLSMLEAMAAGLPTVAHSLPAIREIHVQGETALLAPAENVDAVADALARLTGDAALRERMGKAARERSRRYSFDQTLDAYEGLYREIAHGQAGWSPSYT
jgi:glycosyltransferase involved in cell wall biosynthesis